MKQRLIYMVVVGMSLSSPSALAYSGADRLVIQKRVGEMNRLSQYAAGSFDCAERRNAKLLKERSFSDSLHDSVDVKAGSALGEARSASANESGT